MHPDLGDAQGIPEEIIRLDKNPLNRLVLYLERIQLFPATARLQDTPAVAVSASRVKRIALENGRIHVRSKN